MMKKFTPAIHHEKNLARIKREKWKRGSKSRDPACVFFLVVTVGAEASLNSESVTLITLTIKTKNRQPTH